MGGKYEFLCILLALVSYLAALYILYAYSTELSKNFPNAYIIALLFFLFLAWILLFAFIDTEDDWRYRRWHKERKNETDSIVFISVFTALGVTLIVKGAEYSSMPLILLGVAFFAIGLGSIAE